MDNQDIQNQFDVAKQMAQQINIQGTIYIDFNPEAGFLRLKISAMPPERQSLLTSSFAQVLAQASQMFGLQVKSHEANAGKVGTKG
jgi:hypothetical protein